VNLKYWQCPNNEAHTLRYKYRGMRSGKLECSLCKVDAIFSEKPRAAQPPADAKER
jgi:hypothetical protein